MTCGDWRLAQPRRVFIRAVDMAAIAAATAELFAPRAREAGLELSCTTGPCTILGDEELLRELVTNLLANAIQYTPRGGRVEVDVACDSRVARLQVADTGIGIDADAAGHLFEEFYRSSQARAAFAEGTGMGLSIVKRICELHSGRVWASPRESGGTVFIVELPRA